MLYILFHCCYLFIYYVAIHFILLIKWILQNFYEFQRRETLATNRIVENNKKAGERNLEENLEVDGIFTTSMDSPECLQILFNCLQNVAKNVKEIHDMQKKTQSSQIKGELQLKELSEAVEFITKKFDQYETERKEKEKIINDLQGKVSDMSNELDVLKNLLD